MTLLAAAVLDGPDRALRLPRCRRYSAHSQWDCRAEMLQHQIVPPRNKNSLADTILSPDLAFLAYRQLPPRNFSLSSLWQCLARG